MAFQSNPLKAFSKPYDMDGYADNYITDDLITDLYLDFSERTWRIESEKYLRTLTGKLTQEMETLELTKLLAKTLSIDNTFRVAAKVTIVDKQKGRVKLMKGGLVSTLNEGGQTVSWACTDSFSVHSLSVEELWLAPMPKCIPRRDQRVFGWIRTSLQSAQCPGAYTGHR
jgi:hypothetical protein